MALAGKRGCIVPLGVLCRLVDEISATWVERAGMGTFYGMCGGGLAHTALWTTVVNVQLKIDARNGRLLRLSGYSCVRAMDIDVAPCGFATRLQSEGTRVRRRGSL